MPENGWILLVRKTLKVGKQLHCVSTYRWYIFILLSVLLCSINTSLGGGCKDLYMKLYFFFCFLLISIKIPNTGLNGKYFAQDYTKLHTENGDNTDIEIQNFLGNFHI